MHYRRNRSQDTQQERIAAMVVHPNSINGINAPVTHTAPCLAEKKRRGNTRTNAVSTACDILPIDPQQQQQQQMQPPARKIGIGIDGILFVSIPFHLWPTLMSRPISKIYQIPEIERENWVLLWEIPQIPCAQPGQSRGRYVLPCHHHRKPSETRARWRWRSAVDKKRRRINFFDQAWSVAMSYCLICKTFAGWPV